MSNNFKKIFDAFDYENGNAFFSNFHGAASVEGKTYICNSGQFLMLREDVEKVMELCKEYLKHIDNSFVDNYNESLLSFRSEQRKQEDKVNNLSRREAKQKGKTTFIYVMLNQRNKLYKIGRSKNPDKREATLQSEEPEIEMLFNFPGTLETETKIHQYFAAKRVRGEWFEINEQDLEYIKGLATDELA